MKRLIAASLLLLGLAGCGGSAQPYSTDFFAMDTFMSVKVLSKDGESLAQQCESEINSLESVLSRTREDTDIAKLNAADGAEVTLSDEGAKLLSLALDLSAATNGAYDPTVAPLTDLWGIGTDHQKVPSQSEIDAALQTVGTRRHRKGLRRRPLRGYSEKRGRERPARPWRQHPRRRHERGQGLEHRHCRPGRLRRHHRRRCGA